MKQICGDCLHYNACAAWNIGSLANTEAGGCVNFEHYHLYDAIEVVRCKDCKHFEQAECPWDDLFVINVNDYCSKGQRKEDGE